MTLSMPRSATPRRMKGRTLVSKVHATGIADGGDGAVISDLLQKLAEHGPAHRSGRLQPNGRSPSGLTAAAKNSSRLMIVFAPESLQPIR